jgi:hypothetical protein
MTDIKDILNIISEQPEQPILGSLIATIEISSVVSGFIYALIQIGVVPKFSPQAELIFIFLFYIFIVFSLFLVRNYQCQVKKQQTQLEKQ